MTKTFTQLGTEALLDLGCLRAGQTASTDILTAMLASGNEMLDSWLLDDLLVLTFPVSQYTLTAGISNYIIGTGATAQTINGVQFGAFDASRPTGIEDVNIILNTVSPVLRTPVEIINKDQYADIRVQQIPTALPLKMYYDQDFDAVSVGSGWATINLWPGPLASYLLEIYSSDQTVLRVFEDLTTPHGFPPGYARLLRKGIALECVPLLNMYCKAARTDSLMAPVPMMIDRVERQFLGAKDLVASGNQDDPILSGDPAYAASSKRGVWNYLLGTNGRQGR